MEDVKGSGEKQVEISFHCKDTTSWNWPFAAWLFGLCTNLLILKLWQQFPLPASFCKILFNLAWSLSI